MGIAHAALEADDKLARLAGVRELLAKRGVLVVPAQAIGESMPEIRREPGSLPTGFAALDALLPGGFPRRAMSEVLGSAACGKTSLITPALSLATRAGGLAAFVDAAAEAYPPAMAAAGMRLDRMLWVRPPAEDGDPQHALWAAEVLLQSGAFDAVVLDTSTLVVPRKIATERRVIVLRAAAEANGSAFFVLGSDPIGAPPAVRLRVAAIASAVSGARRVRVVVEKSRYGAVGAEAELALESSTSLGYAGIENRAL